jgi:integrase/recombinase XerD
VKFSQAIDDFIRDGQSQGRLNTPRTIDAYRDKLNAHCDDVSNRDPALTGRDDVKRTLRRWTHPNSQRQAHSILTSFYDWAMEEGIRETNPARQARRAKPRQVNVYRPTRDEVVRLLHAHDTHRERRAIHLGVLAGARRQELQGFQRRHFMTPGWVWISPDIAKGGRERWVPVLEELEPVVAEIVADVELGEFVIPALRRGNPKVAVQERELREKQISGTGLYKLVKRVGERAQLGQEIGPHTLRHAFGDHVARYGGLRLAQAVLGHASVATTEGSYMGRVSRDEIAVGLSGFRYERLSAPDGAVIPDGVSNAR